MQNIRFAKSPIEHWSVYIGQCFFFVKSRTEYIIYILDRTDINILQTSNGYAHYNSHPQSWRTLERRKREDVSKKIRAIESERDRGWAEGIERENGANELDKEEFLTWSREYAQNTNWKESKACRMTLAESHQ